MAAEKRVKKCWRLVAKINSCRQTYKDFDEEPTDDDALNFANLIDSDFCDIKLEIYWKQIL